MIKKSSLLCLFTLVFFVAIVAQERQLREIEVAGSGYERGLAHGQALKNEIAEIIHRWRLDANSTFQKDPDQILDDFFSYAEFTPAIQKWTPDLYDEMRGIAEGSGQSLRDIYALNLVDEFWVYINNLQNHHCSSMGVPARDGRPAYVAQNMDLPTYTDGLQVLMRIRGSGDMPEQLLLTCPGLIVLNGMNRNGVAVAVNTLMHLKASSTGLPVAFVIRAILRRSDRDDILDFIRSVPHASGQNYIVGIGDEVYDFEASSNKVVRYQPENPNGAVYHTNHPEVNDDIKPWFSQFDPKLDVRDRPLTSNSYLRFQAVQKRMSIKDTIKDTDIMAALRSRDNEVHPVCRSNLGPRGGFTFGSVIMTLSPMPFMLITSGPPDESEYVRYQFSSEQTDR